MTWPPFRSIPSSPAWTSTVCIIARWVDDSPACCIVIMEDTSFASYSQITPRLLLEGEIDDQTNCLDRSLAYSIDDLKRVRPKSSSLPAPRHTPKALYIPSSTNSIEDISWSASQTSSDAKELPGYSYTSSAEDIHSRGSLRPKLNKSYQTAVEEGSTSPTDSAFSHEEEFRSFDRTLLQYRSMISPYQYRSLIKDSVIPRKPFRYSLLPPLRHRYSIHHDSPSGSCAGYHNGLMMGRAPEVLSRSWDNALDLNLKDLFIAPSREQSASMDNVHHTRVSIYFSQYPAAFLLLNDWSCFYSRVWRNKVFFPGASVYLPTKAAWFDIYLCHPFWGNWNSSLACSDHWDFTHTVIANHACHVSITQVFNFIVIFVYFSVVESQFKSTLYLLEILTSCSSHFLHMQSDLIFLWIWKFFLTYTYTSYSLLPSLNVFYFSLLYIYSCFCLMQASAWVSPLSSYSSLD